MAVPSSLPSFLRRFAIAFVVVTLLAGGVVFASNSYEKRKFAQSKKIHVPNLQKVEQGKPANYLLIGSDSRQGADSDLGDPTVTPGQRSDVMMILHVEPQAKTGLLVSFPRDLLVNIPGHGQGQLNSVYNLGGATAGPQMVIETLEANFPPLKINHYLEVDFTGFRDIVNAIGKIHLWFPTPVHDPYSGLNVDQAGCLSVDGTTALAYARSRHYFIPKNLQNPTPWQWDYSDPGNETKFRGGTGWQEDGLADLDRIPRQQYFLRTLSQAAIDKTAANPTKLFGLLEAVQKSFTHDDSLKLSELQALVRTFNKLDPRRVQMLTLPVAGVESGRNKGRVVPTDAAQVVINSLMFFRTATPPPLPPLLKPAEVNVRIVNGSGIPGLGDQAVAEFTAAGYHVTGPAQDADRTNFGQTQIRYAPGKLAGGYTAATALNTFNLIEANSANDTLGADVLVIVGHDYATHPKNLSLTGVTTTTTPVTAAGAPTPTSTSTTTTTLPSRTTDTRYVPVDSNGGPLVGCPKK